MQKEYNKQKIIDLMFAFFKETRKDNPFDEPAIEIIDWKILLICNYIIHQWIKKIQWQFQKYRHYYFLIKQDKYWRYKLLYKFKRKNWKETIKVVNNKKEIKNFLEINLRLD